MTTINRLLDMLAVVLFPSRKYVWATIVLYAFLIAAVLVWYTGNWLWVPATALCMVFAAMLIEWFF